MAKQHYGINDGYRGTVGTVIGYEWRGQWCLRAKPRRVRNPRTERQQKARGLFSRVSQLASHLRSVLRIGMHTEAVRMHRTECNHFMSVNSDCFSLEGGQLTIDYESLTLSIGPVAPVGFETPQITEGCTVTVPFERNPQHLCSSNDDQVYLYAWCPEMDEGVLSVPAYRRSRQVTVELPERWAGCEVHLYGFVEDYAGRTSDSSYIGCGQIPSGDLTKEESPDSQESEDSNSVSLTTSRQGLFGAADEGVFVVVGGVEGLLDGLGRSPTDEVEVGTGLVVGAAGAGTAEGLLANDSSGGLVVEVDVAGGILQQVVAGTECLAVA